MKYAVYLFIFLLLASTEVIGQTYTLNLQKYWWYRYRLVNDFMKIGPDFGESIPIEQRGGVNPDDGQKWLKSGDALQKLGNYLVLLATEYKMLTLCKLSSGRTKEELYYALNALNRLDLNSEEYYRHWNDPVNGNVYSLINHPIQNNIGMVPHTTGNDVWKNDFNGHYIRDDINEYFVSNNSVHFNRTGLCDDQKISEVTSDFTIRNNENHRGTLSVWLANNINPRVPVEISLDQATELIKGMAMVIYLVPQSETVTIDGTVYSVKDMAKECLLRLVNYCSNPNTGSIGGTLGWRNWQIINPVYLWCVYGIDGNLSNPCFPGKGGGANMSLMSMGVVDVLGQINAGWNSTQSNTIKNLGGLPPWFVAGYQLSKSWPGFGCSNENSLFSTTIASISNDWRLFGFNVSQYFVFGQSFPCQIRYPQLPLIYRVLHGGLMPHPENSYPFVWQALLPFPTQVGLQNSYVTDLDAASLCGNYAFGFNYPSWQWSSYDWVTEPAKRGSGQENAWFPGIDYMSIFNLYCMNDPGYPKFYSNPYYRENLSQVYPYTNGGITYGDAIRPTYLKYLEYLSSTSHVLLGGHVTYRCGQQIELLPGFQADNGSNFLAYIKDYGCGDCSGDGFNPNSKDGFHIDGFDGDGGLDFGDDDGPFTIDSLEDTVQFVPYDIPIDTSIQYEPTDSLLALDSLNLMNIVMSSGDSEFIAAVQQMLDGSQPGGNQRIHKGNEGAMNPAGLSISPNPNNGTFIISMPDDENYEVFVTSIFGELIYHEAFKGNRNEINLSNAPPGNYLVRVISAHSIDVAKISVMR